MIAVCVPKATHSVAFGTQTAIFPGGTANQARRAGLLVADLIVVKLAHCAEVRSPLTTGRATPQVAGQMGKLDRNVKVSQI
jgi:hypothetical protein